MENQQAPQRLDVCVILVQEKPTAWWHSLLHQIETHPHLRLTRILICSPDTPDRTKDQKQSARSTKLVKWLASTIMQKIVDKPQFQHDPLERSVPESCFQDRIEHITAIIDGSQSSLNTAMAHERVDVTIQSHETCEQFIPTFSTRVWKPDFESLHTQATAALTARDPFFRVRLLQRLNENPDTTCPHTDWAILAKHTLPLQTFSITDLEVAAHACLPSLFMTQLNRLRLGHEPNRTAEHDSGFFKGSASNTTTSGNIEPELGTTIGDQSPTSQLRSALRLLWQQFRKRLLDQLFYEQWQLGFLGDIDITDSIEGLTSTPMESYQSLTPPDLHSWADPHLATHDGSLHVFFETIEAERNLGWIDCARLDQSIFSHRPTKVLTSDHHLSYPFTFEHDHQHWMIPETASEATVSLYRCTRFPDRWEKVTNLMVGVNVADCTILRRDDRWWLFGNTMTHPTVDERDELRIWFADELSGPWQPHPLNPVLTGVHHARMAGGFLHSGGQLIRPSQFGGWRYGHAINLARIDRLTTEDYLETIVGQIRPAPGSPWLGCHSIAHQNGATLIDRVRRRSRLGQWLRARVSSRV